MFRVKSGVIFSTLINNKNEHSMQTMVKFFHKSQFYIQNFPSLCETKAFFNGFSGLTVLVYPQIFALSDD